MLKLFIVDTVYHDFNRFLSELSVSISSSYTRQLLLCFKKSTIACRSWINSSGVNGILIAYICHKDVIHRAISMSLKKVYVVRQFLTKKIESIYKLLWYYFKYLEGKYTYTCHC